MSIKRYFISYTLNGLAQTKPVHPIDGGIALGLESDDYVYREKFNNKYTFKNIKRDSVYDFDLLKSIEAVDPFTPIIFRVEKKINGVFEEIEQGRFVIADCDIDNDKCLIEVTPEIYDPYTCIDDIKDTEYNILQEVPIAPPFMILNPADLEYFTCTKDYTVYITYVNGCARPVSIDFNGNPIDNNYPDSTVFGLPYDLLTVNQSGVSVLDSHTLYNPETIFANSCLYNQGTSDTLNNIILSNPTNLPYIIDTMLRIYSNEFYVHPGLPIPGNSLIKTVTVKTTWCLETTITLNDPVTHANVPPVGAGWLPLYQLYQGGLLACKWGREAFYANQLYKYFLSTNTCDTYLWELLNPYTLESAGHLDIYRGRMLNDTIQMYLDKANCGLTFKSDFLQQNLNPVTGERNPSYVLNDGSDIKTPLPTASPATINFLTFKKLLDNICDTFNLKWIIKDGYFIIEHLKWFENGFSYPVVGIPATDLMGLISKHTGKPEIIRSNRYSYDTGNIYKQEKWNNTAYVDFDFSPLFVDYDLQITKDSNTLTRQIDFVLDAAGIYNNPSSFSNDAIVLIAIREEVIDPANGTTAWVCINEPGYRTNEEVVNGWMCLSNLFNRFWRHGRMKLTGTMNALPEQFESETGKILQKVEIKDCSLKYFKDDLHFTTELGTGRKISGQHKIDEETTQLEILI